MFQLFANILYTTFTIFIVAVSFSIIYSTTKFFHFAHAAIITFGAYLYFAFSIYMDLPMFLSVALALAAGTGLGWCLELSVYRPMRRNGASSLILLLSSLGLYIVLQNGISMFFGDDTKIIAGSSVAASIKILGARITIIQLIVMSVAVAVFFTKIFLVDKTRIGLALRAVADSAELSKVCGVEFDRTIGIAFCIGSFLGSAAGLLQAFDVGMTPTMGLPMLLLGVVAAIVGEKGKTLGVAFASLLLACLKNIASWQLGSHWEETASFLLLLAFLLCCCQGMFRKIMINV